MRGAGAAAAAGQGAGSSQRPEQSGGRRSAGPAQLPPRGSGSARAELAALGYRPRFFVIEKTKVNRKNIVISTDFDRQFLKPTLTAGEVLCFLGGTRCT